MNNVKTIFAPPIISTTSLLFPLRRGWDRRLLHLNPIGKRRSKGKMKIHFDCIFKLAFAFGFRFAVFGSIALAMSFALLSFLLCPIAHLKTVKTAAHQISKLQKAT